MTYKKAKKELQKIADDYKNTELKRNVAEMIIDEADGYETIEGWFEDLFNHGCVSGMVGGLIHYVDTHKFYDDNYSDIEDLRFELEEKCGEAFNVKDDLKNFYAWLAFEETAREIYHDLGFDEY